MCSADPNSASTLLASGHPGVCWSVRAMTAHPARSGVLAQGALPHRSDSLHCHLPPGLIPDYPASRKGRTAARSGPAEPTICAAVSSAPAHQRCRVLPAILRSSSRYVGTTAGSGGLGWRGAVTLSFADSLFEDRREVYASIYGDGPFGGQ